MLRIKQDLIIHWQIRQFFVQWTESELEHQIEIVWYLFLGMFFWEHAIMTFSNFNAVRFKQIKYYRNEYDIRTDNNNYSFNKISFIFPILRLLDISFIFLKYTFAIIITYKNIQLRNYFKIMDFFFRDKNAPVVLSRELHQLIETIGETKTKQQQQRIIKAEIERVKTSLQSEVQLKNYPDILVKLIYFQTLGYNTSFAKILPINLSQYNNMYIKKISYLLAAMLVRPGEKLAILMQNTIMKDLESENVFAKLIVLTMFRYFINQDLVNDTIDKIRILLKNKLGMVRRKSLLVIFNIYQKYPHLVTDLKEITIAALSDPEVPVIFAALSILRLLVVRDPLPFKNQTPKLVQILEKILDHKYPPQYDYHKVPAPWMQIDILKMLEKLGRNDPNTSKLMFDVLEKCIKRSQNIYLIFNRGILQQCIKTSSIIYPHQFLLNQSQKSLDTFFIDGNNNLKSFGLAAMIHLAKIRPFILEKWQVFLVQCLQSEDITLAERTISLLVEIANQQNTQVILNKIIMLAERSTDSAEKRKLIRNGIYLIQRFSNEKQIFLRRMNEIFYKFEEFVSEASINNFLKTLLEMIELEPEFSDFLVTTYTQILDNFRNPVLVKVSVWILGEVSHKIYLRDKNSEFVDEAITMMLNCAEQFFTNQSILFYIVVSLMKLSPIQMTSKSDQIKQFLFKVEALPKYSNHKIAQQFIRIAKYSSALYNSSQLELDSKMRFLSSYVQQNYDGPPKTQFLISKKKFKKGQSNDLDLLNSEHQGKQHKNNNIFEFKAGQRWGTNTGPQKQQIRKQSLASNISSDADKKLVLRGPHQQKRSKNQVDIKKLKLANSIFGTKN